MSWIDRPTYRSRILPFQNKPLIKVLTGMRRVGKSSLVRLLMERLYEQGVPESHVIYINKESMEWDTLRDHTDLYGLVDAQIKAIHGKPYIFIDEAQD